MNVKKLKEDWLKNTNRLYSYKEIVQLLETKTKSSGKSRNYQFKDWERYFNFYKPNPCGHKFIITEIYNEPKPKIDGRGTNTNSHHNQNGMYGKYVDKLLYTNIYNTRNSSPYLPLAKSVIANTIGMTNSNYILVKRDLLKYLECKKEVNSKMTFINVNDVTDIVNSTITNVIDSSLQRLSKDKLITYYKGMIAVEGIKTRIPTSDEMIELQRIEDSTLVELKIENKSILFVNYPLMKQYYTQLNKNIKSFYGGRKTFFKGYLIKPVKNKYIDNSKYLITSKEEFFSLMQDLNKLMVEETYKKAMRRKEKIVKERGGFMGKPNPMWEDYILDRLDDNYEDNIKEVISDILPLDYSQFKC